MSVGTYVYHRRVKGSYTVEAAFLVPFCIWIMLSFLALTFYLYDRTAAEAYVCRALSAVVWEKRGPEEKEEQLDPERIGAGTTRFTLTESTAGENVSLEAEGESRLLCALAGIFRPGEGIGISETRTVVRRYGEKRLREERALLFSQEGS